MPNESPPNMNVHEDQWMGVVLALSVAPPGVIQRVYPNINICVIFGFGSLETMKNDTSPGISS